MKIRRYKIIAERLAEKLENAHYAVKGMYYLGHDDIALDYMARKAWIRRRMFEAGQTCDACYIAQEWAQGFRGSHVLEHRKMPDYGSHMF